MLEILDAIRNRRSARSYEARDIPDNILNELLLAAQAAPSGGNGQAHVFGIVREQPRKDALAEAAGGQKWIAEAPVVIACCARLDKDWHDLPENDFGLRVNNLRFGDQFVRHLLAYPEWQETAVLLADAVPLIPAEHMILAAKAHGIEGCIIGWLDVQKASEIFKAARGYPLSLSAADWISGKSAWCKKAAFPGGDIFYETYQTSYNT